MEFSFGAFVPSPLGFPDDGVLAVYSLKQHNFYLLKSLELAYIIVNPKMFTYEEGISFINTIIKHYVRFWNIDEKPLFCIFTGPNAITVSLSPLGGYVMVGLAARKLHWHMSTKQVSLKAYLVYIHHSLNGDVF